MKRAFLLLAVITAIIFVQAQEKQVAMDNSGKIILIDEQLEKRLQLFEDYPDFNEARLFQINDNEYLLEIVYLSEGAILREKKKMDTLMVQEFRNKVSEVISTKSPNALLNQEGRSSFLAASTMISSIYYGTAVSTILNPDGFNNYLTTSLITTGAGFFVPFLLTKKMEMTRGQAMTATYGQSRGIIHGMMLPVVFSQNPDYRVTLGFGVAGSIAEAVLGYQWAKKHNISYGQSMAMSVYGDFGMGIALGTSHVLGILNNNNFGANLAALSTLAGAAGGLILGNNLAKKDYYSPGDAIVLGGAGALGAYIPMSLMSVTSTENPKLYTLVGTLGAIGGLMIGDKIAQKHDFSIRQGVYIYLSETAGALVGMGLGYALGASFDNTSVLAVMTGLGALAGYALTTRNYMKDINKEDKDLSFNLKMNPLGLMTMTGKTNGITGSQGAPLLMGSIRF